MSLINYNINQNIIDHDTAAQLSIENISDKTGLYIFTAVMCHPPFEYKTCDNPCPPSCAVDFNGDGWDEFCNNTQCIEGCFCPPHLVLHGKI